MSLLRVDLKLSPFLLAELKLSVLVRPQHNRSSCVLTISNFSPEIFVVECQKKILHPPQLLLGNVILLKTIAQETQESGENGPATVVHVYKYLGCCLVRAPVDIQLSFQVYSRFRWELWRNRDRLMMMTTTKKT